MRIRDYNIGDTDRITAEFLNQVTGDFSNAMTEAYLELRELKNRNTMFKSATGNAFDYLISSINVLTSAQSGLQISAYRPPESSNNVQLDHSYGQITLEETNRVTHIPLQEDNFGSDRAISSVEVESGSTESNFATDANLRVVIDGENEIWTKTLSAAQTTSGSIWIKVVTPLVGQIPNFVSIYPLSGTEVEEIKVLRQTGNTSFTPNSTWPVKMHQNFSDYSKEVRFKIKGVSDGSGNYIFSLRKIDIYSVTYASQGDVTYITEDTFETISSVTLNNPFFYPSTSQTGSMVRTQILTLDGLTTLYDSFVSSNIDPVPAGPAKVQVKITLHRTDGNTPVFKTVV